MGEAGIQEERGIQERRNGMNVNKVKVGDKVSTIWDDTTEVLKATVEKVYRGHRGKKMVVRMPDRTLEIVGADQVVGITYLS